jgi:hypothetical protein
MPSPSPSCRPACPGSPLPEAFLSFGPVPTVRYGAKDPTRYAGFGGSIGGYALRTPVATERPRLTLDSREAPLKTQAEASTHDLRVTVNAAVHLIEKRQQPLLLEQLDQGPRQLSEVRRAPAARRIPSPHRRVPRHAVEESVIAYRDVAADQVELARPA